MRSPAFLTMLPSTITSPQARWLPRPSADRLYRTSAGSGDRGLLPRRNAARRMPGIHRGRLIAQDKFCRGRRAVPSGSRDSRRSRVASARASTTACLGHSPRGFPAANGSRPLARRSRCRTRARRHSIQSPNTPGNSRSWRRPAPAGGRQGRLPLCVVARRKGWRTGRRHLAAPSRSRSVWSREAGPPVPTSPRADQRCPSSAWW